jgi:tetratricopeptide (TPR) repeat protein
MLANSASKTGDKNTYVYAMEKLVTYYPKKDYWVDLLNRVQGKPGFSDRLSLDVLRLRFALGQIQSTTDYLELSQLAIQAGVPAEAIKVIDQGFKNGALGTGPSGERHQALRKLANTKLAEQQRDLAQTEKDAQANADGTALVNLGYALVTMGQNDKGLDLINQGLKKGGFKRADDTKLRAGEGMLLAGRKQQAVQTLRSVQGKDGTADIARFWILQSNHS